MARVLLSLALPAHILFLVLTEFVNNKYFFTPSFLIIYLLVGMTQVVILLQIAYNFVHWLWSVGVDPDNSAIPFLTALADLIGSLLLATAFASLYGIRDPNAYTPPVVDTATHSLIINPVTPSSIVSTQHILSSL